MGTNDAETIAWLILTSNSKGNDCRLVFSDKISLKWFDRPAVSLTQFLKPLSYQLFFQFINSMVWRRGPVNVRYKIVGSKKYFSLF